MPSKKTLVYERCGKGEVKQYIRFLNERFGIPTKLLKKYVYLKKGRNIWVFSGDSNVLNDFKRIESIGVKLLTIKKRGVKPTTTAIQIFGRYASKNVVELESEEELIEFMTGGLIKREFEADKGFVIVKFREDILGCGLYSSSGLLSQIPKHRRIDRRWIVDA